jgi:predicted secreted hydrolase
MKRILVLFLFLAVSCSDKQTDTGQEISVADAMSTTDSGYAKALEPIDFEFPRDHGPHEDYKIEWWYLPETWRIIPAGNLGTSLQFSEML